MTHDETMDAGRLAQWREAMLGEGSLRLQSLGRNYLGLGKVGRDKGKVVSGLAAMMSDPEVQRAALGMMDRIDMLIVGSASVAGEAGKSLLQNALAGELSYNELEYRLANLGERLLLFRTKEGNFAVNPWFAAAARATAARADALFGPDPAAPRLAGEDAGGAGAASASAPLSVQDLGLVVYGLLKENKDILLKSGQLSVRTRKRLTGLFPGDPNGAAVVEAIIGALAAGKLLTKDEHGLSADFKAIAELLFSSEGDFAFSLACMSAGWFDRGRCGVFARSFGPFMERRFAFSPSGLARLVRLLPGGETTPAFPEAFAKALGELGLVEDKDGDLVCSPERAAAQWRTTPNDIHAAISVDGTGIIHVLPSASLYDLVALLDIGILVSASGAWEITVTRESIRRAFAAGRTIEDIERLLEGMSRMPVPQALRFDIGKWEEEYDSIRLFRGYLLSADRGSAKIIEQSGALARFPHEMLGEGLYYFGNVQASTIEKVLKDIGLPPPSLRSSAKPAQARAHRAAAPAPHPQARQDDEAKVSIAAADSFAASTLSFSGEDIPSPERSLEMEIAQLQVPPDLRKKLEERLKRKLIYTPGQLHAMVEAENADNRPGGPSAYREAGIAASGLDFNGKLRVIQAALKAKYSRLDIRCAEDGEVKARSVRPVVLHKTEKDYILEGEDVSSGGPISIRVGTMMQVSLHKGFLLGEE